MIVIVTGSAGYIGGQTMLELKDAGHEVYGIDRRDPPEHLRGVPNGFLYQDFASDVALSWIIQKQPDAIIHCAGTSLVGPSMLNPAEYYNNNIHIKIGITGMTLICGDDDNNNKSNNTMMIMHK